MKNNMMNKDKKVLKKENKMINEMAEDMKDIVDSIKKNKY